MSRCCCCFWEPCGNQAGRLCPLGALGRTLGERRAQHPREGPRAPLSSPVCSPPPPAQGSRDTPVSPVPSPAFPGVSLPGGGTTAPSQGRLNLRAQALSPWWLPGAGFHDLSWPLPKTLSACCCPGVLPQPECGAVGPPHPLELSQHSPHPLGAAPPAPAACGGQGTAGGPTVGRAGQAQLLGTELHHRRGFLVLRPLPFPY